MEVKGLQVDSLKTFFLSEKCLLLMRSCRNSVSESELLWRSFTPDESQLKVIAVFKAFQLYTVSVPAWSYR